MVPRASLLLLLLLVVFLLLPASSSLCTEAAFLCPRPTPARAGSSVLAAAGGSGAEEGGDLKSSRGMKQALVVLVGDTCTRLYNDLWNPESVSIQQPADQRFLERHGGRGRPRHHVGAPVAGHFTPPQPKAGRSTYPDLLKNYFRPLEESMEAADAILIMGHGKGKGQAAEVLLKDMARVRPQLTAKVKGLVRLDDTHVSDRQVLQLARHVLLGRPDPRKRRIIHGQPMQ